MHYSLTKLLFSSPSSNIIFKVFRWSCLPFRPDNWFCYRIINRSVCITLIAVFASIRVCFLVLFYMCDITFNMSFSIVSRFFKMTWFQYLFVTVYASVSNHVESLSLCLCSRSTLSPRTMSYGTAPRFISAYCLPFSFSKLSLSSTPILSVLVSSK